MKRRTVFVLAALAFATLTEAVHLSLGAPIDFLILDTTLGVLFIAAGAVAWRRRPEVRTGPLLTLSGTLWFAASYTPMPIGPLSALGFTVSGLYDFPLAYLLLTFPAERLVGTHRVALGALGLGLVIRSAGRLLLAPHELALFPTESGFQSVESVTNWLVAGAALVVAALALVRWARARALLRRIGWPLFGAGVLAMGLAAFDAAEAAMDRPLFPVVQPPLDLVVGWAPFVARALIPFGFLVSTLQLRRGRLAVAESALKTSGASTVALERALATTLGDPELAILRWSAAAGCYIDREGRPVDPPQPGDSVRAATYIDDDGRPYAAVVHDALLIEERSIIASMRNAARHALLGEDLRATVGDRTTTASLPRGDVTLLFSDIEGSTAHLQRLGLQYADALEQHRSIIRGALREHGGSEVEAVGDEFLAAFESPSAAARAAIAIQRRLQSHRWPDGVPIAVRIGLHRGTPTVTSSGYVGLDVHRAARIMSAANGGQVLASISVAASVATDLGSDIAVRQLGSHSFRGLADPIDVALLEAPEVVTSSVPIRAQPANQEASS